MSNQREEKKTLISWHFKQIMSALDLDLTDDSLIGTPDRVAKMYVDEIFCGLWEENYPKMHLQENKFNYDQMLIERDIVIKSFCEHHFVPIVGVAHIAYIPDKKVIGLSKLNRIAEYYARRPQVQERLTKNIADDLKKHLGTDNVAVVIDAEHLCVSMRGIEHMGAKTRTTSLNGSFKDELIVRQEFMASVGECK